MGYEIDDVYSFTARLLSPLKLNDACRVILDASQEMMATRSGSIYIEINGKLSRIYSTVPSRLRVESRENGNTKRAFTERKTIILEVGEFKKIHPEFKQQGVNSIVIIPLTTNGKCIAVMTLQSGKTVKSLRQNLKLIGLFGSIASLKLRNVLAYEKIVEALKSRDLFISIASHELKTPTTTLKGYTELLLKYAKSGKKIKAEWIETIETQIKRLSVLIDQLLRADQIKRGKANYNFRKIDIAKLFKRAILDLHFHYPKHKVELQLKGSKKRLFISGNYVKLTRLFTNILNNAAKFSRTGSLIQIVITQNGSFVQVDISDEGMGIIKKDRPKIFQQFYKGSGHTREGLGLGLFIAKTIVDEHSGVIKILKSKEKKGTTVRITLPL